MELVVFVHSATPADNATLRRLVFVKVRKFISVQSVHEQGDV